MLQPETLADQVLLILEAINYKQARVIILFVQVYIVIHTINIIL